MSLPRDHDSRKKIPIARGFLDYFPDAVAAVAELSRIGNEQHNPGEEIHWAREKSTDHADCIVRHLIDRGRLDVDNIRHSTKLAWRALALLQVEIEQENKLHAHVAAIAGRAPPPCPDLDGDVSGADRPDGVRQPCWCGDGLCVWLISGYGPGVGVYCRSAAEAEAASPYGSEGRLKSRLASEPKPGLKTQTEIDEDYAARTGLARPRR